MEYYEADYFEYLVGLIEGPDNIADDYYELLENLFVEDFFWLLKRDDSRAKDGLGLRAEYCSLLNRDLPDVYGHLDGNCSVLEMLIALARRWDYDLVYDFDLGDRSYIWFWEMIDNLRLGFMKDGRFDGEMYDEIISHFLNREYCKDGLGGLFYIPGIDKDMREAEIWTQLNWYILYKDPVSFDVSC